MLARALIEGEETPLARFGNSSEAFSDDLPPEVCVCENELYRILLGLLYNLVLHHPC